MLRKPKKDLLIHIGTGKTGTTSLQHLFWANRGVLKKHGILYPDLGVVAGAHHLLSPHIAPFLKWNFIPAKEWAPELYRRADRPALISSEIICNTKPEIIRRFARHVQRHFNVKIVIYVRRQDHWMMASYSQMVKAGTQYLDLNSSFERWSQRFDFGERIRTWVDTFGADNVVIRPYERAQLRDGDIRSDFLGEVLGIEDISGFKSSEANENPRLTLSALEYKRMINNVVRDTQASSQFNDPLLAYSAAIDRNSTAIYNESNLLSGMERKMILERSRETNTWIARELMGRLDGVLFTDPEPKVDPDWFPPVITTEDLADIGAHLKAKGHAKELMRLIEHALEGNRFEAYRSAQALALSIGHKV